MSDEAFDAERVMIAGSSASASLTIQGQQAAGIYRPVIVNTDGALKIYDIVNGTVAVTGTLTGITNSLAVHILSTGGTLQVKTDPSSVITGITSSIAIVPFTPAGSQMTDEGFDAQRVLIAGSHAAASIEVKGTLTGITNSLAVNLFTPAGTNMADEGFDAARVLITGSHAAASLEIKGTLTGITNSLAVYFDRANPAVSVTNASFAINPFTPAGSTMSDEGFDAQRVLIAGSHAAASIEVKGTLTGITNSIGVYFDRGNPAVNITSGTLTGITNSVAVNLFTPAGTNISDEGFDAERVLIAGSHASASLTILGQQAAGTLRPVLVNTDGALKIYDIATGTVSVTGTITGITNSIAVHVLSTGGTIQVKTDPSSVLSGITSSIAVYFDRGEPTVAKQKASTGTYTGVAVATSARQIAAALSTRRSISLVHDNNSTVYIGLTSAVTSAATGNGFPLVANQIFSMDDYTGAVFGVLESGVSFVKYIEI